MKAACTVWSRGKAGDHFKGLPMAIVRTDVLQGLPGRGEAGRCAGPQQHRNHPHLPHLHRGRTRKRAGTAGPGGIGQTLQKVPIRQKTNRQSTYLTRLFYHEIHWNASSQPGLGMAKQAKQVKFLFGLGSCAHFYCPMRYVGRVPTVCSLFSPGQTGLWRTICKVCPTPACVAHTTNCKVCHWQSEGRR